MNHPLLDPDAALRMVREASRRLETETCASTDALGRILAADVTAASALPPFDNSAMDGFALHGDAAPIPAGSEWPIAGEQAAGDAGRRADGGAWAIMTGARLPEGLDRVIPVERIERLDNPPRVRLLADVVPRQNVRDAGSDVGIGDTVLAAGTLLAPQHLMLLTALGVANVAVVQRPRVAVLCTGRELVDDPAQALESGQIRNSSGSFLAARIARAGAVLVHAETVGDEVAPFLAAFERARAGGARVVLSTGAVSMGHYDFVPQALAQLHAEIVFHKLAIRPGKPLLFARLPDGTLFFGLPGNPVSTAVGQRFFVAPALRAMLGLPPEVPWRVALDHAYTKKPGFRMYLKSRVVMRDDGRLGATILPGQQSYRIRPLADANAWVVIPSETTAMAAGEYVDVYGLGPLESPFVSSAAAVGPAGRRAKADTLGGGTAVGPAGPPTRADTSAGATGAGAKSTRPRQSSSPDGGNA